MSKPLGPLLREVAAVGGMNKQAKKNLGGVLKKPKPRKAEKCRTCNNTGLANSGVPSMPMPCPACSKAAKKKGKR